MVKTTVVFDDKKDADLIAWLTGQGNKNKAIRDTLRLAIATQQAMYTAPALDLTAIRRVFEAVLDERLAGAISTPQQTGDPALDAKLDTMF